MISGFGGAALGLLLGYLLLFFRRGALAEKAAGRPVGLFARATGRDGLAAIGFRAAFLLAFFGPLVWLAWRVPHKVDPFWSDGETAALGLIGVLIAGVGATVAFAAQMSMGSSCPGPSPSGLPVAKQHRPVFGQEDAEGRDPEAARQVKEGPCLEQVRGRAGDGGREQASIGENRPARGP